MKNTKLNIRKLSRSGFSLVEMLVVIAIIGIMAAIAIPNISGINDAAVKATAQRNAQNIASLAATVRAAGETLDSDKVEAVEDLLDGITPTKGAFKDETLKLSTMSEGDIENAVQFLNDDLEYNKINDQFAASTKE